MQHALKCSLLLHFVIFADNTLHKRKKQKKKITSVYFIKTL